MGKGEKSLKNVLTALALVSLWACRKENKMNYNKALELAGPFATFQSHVPIPLNVEVDVDSLPEELRGTVQSVPAPNKLRGHCGPGGSYSFWDWTPMMWDGVRILVGFRYTRPSETPPANGGTYPAGKWADVTRCSDAVKFMTA